MKIVMVDQDGVLLDKDYKTTVDINGFLQNLPKEVLIVPNSDTPIERIANNFLSITGMRPSVIVGEKGAVVLFGEKIYVLGDVRGIKDFLKKLKAAFAGQDCDIVVGDSATWMREQKMFAPNRKMLIIDGFRRQSVGFYLRSTDKNGVARLDDDWFKVGSEIAKKIPLPSRLEAAGSRLRDFNKGYGIVILSAAGVTKTDGYKFLRQKYPKAIFYMIGDEDTDMIDDPKVIHCAVNNASVNFKKVCRFISDQKITAGLVDCLHWITKQ